MFGAGLSCFLPSVFTGDDSRNSNQEKERDSLQYDNDLPSLRESVISENPIATSKDVPSKDNSVVQDDASVLLQKFNSLSQEYEDLKDMYDLKDNELRQLKISFQGCLIQISQFENESSKMFEKQMEYENQIEVLMTQLREKELLIANYQSEKESLKEGIMLKEDESLKSMIDQMKEEIVAYENENMQLQNANHEQSMTITRLRSELDNQQTENAILEDTIKQLKEESKALEEQLGIERDDFDILLKQQKKELDIQKEQNATLQKTVDQTLENHRITKDKYQALKDQYQQCVSLYRNQKELLDEAAEAIEEKDKRIDVLLQTIDEMNETLGEVKAQIDQFVLLNVCFIWFY